MLIASVANLIDNLSGLRGLHRCATVGYGRAWNPLSDVRSGPDDAVLEQCLLDSEVARAGPRAVFQNELVVCAPDGELDTTYAVARDDDVLRRDRGAENDCVRLRGRSDFVHVVSTAAAREHINVVSVSAAQLVTAGAAVENIRALLTFEVVVTRTAEERVAAPA